MWVVVDQGVSSLTNFAATVLVARSVDPREFGSFGAGFVVYLLVVGVARGLVAQPLTIRASALPDRFEQRAEAARAMGAAVLVGAVAALGVMACGWGVGGATGGVLVVMGLCMPGLVAQDTWRFVFFTLATPKQAAANDLVWLIVQLVLMGGALLVGPTSVVLLAATWSGSAVIAALYGIRQSGLVPEVGKAVAYITRHVDLGGRLAAEFVFQNGSTLVTTLVLGLVVGTAGLGSLRGAQTLYGPFYVLITGLQAAAVPEGSRLLARRSSRLLPLLRTMSAGLAGAAVLWGLVLVSVPDGWGAAALGETWPAALQLVPATMVIMAGHGLASGGLTGLRVVGDVRSSLRVRVLAGVVAFATGVGGGLVAGIEGGAWGLAVGPVLTAVTAWYLLSTSPRAAAALARCAAAPARHSRQPARR
jgi:O-antigen/teichoic acid export membrane protein